jgi:hypothetical protein
LFHSVKKKIMTGCTLKSANRLILSLILTILATSCGVNYHINKAFKKGYRCDEVADTIKITSVDSIPYVLNDSIYFERVLVQKDTIVRYKRSYVPKTRLQTRIEYKLKRDTLKMIEKVEVVKWKTEKNKNTKPNILLLVLGFAVGIFTNYLLRHYKSPL